jgi:8-oxo-dGTP pyrophosphatase MutT (NUDIX family)
LEPLENGAGSAAGSSLRPAAVLALIDPSRADLPLLLLLRSSELRAHPGQIGLPGGSPSPGDGPLWRTALREADEELAVPEGAVDLRGRATLVPTWNSGYAITPFVGLLRYRFEPRAAASEVESYFWFPLLPGGGPPPRISREMKVSEGTFQMPGYLHEEHFVWGATGAIVDDLLARLAPPL